MGVPQGSVLSLLLFNFYSSNISPANDSFEPDVDERYADDNHAACSNVKPDIIAAGLSSAANNLAATASDLDMSISASKSSVTLFTPWNKEFGRLPPVTVGTEQIPQDNNPKLLGVIFDPTWTFNTHAIYTARKAASRLNVLCALSDTSFGHDKECLIQTFKSMIRPFFDYAAPIVYPNYSDTSIKRLQLVQNRCLRLITDNHNASAIDHLHAETHILPVEQHLRLLSAQYLARALNPNHPSHPQVNTPPPPDHRKMKNTLRSKCWDDVEPFLQNGVVRPERVKEVLNNLHMKVVSDTVDNLAPNRVLRARPPLIHPSETTLARESRAVLSQLRSGFCSRLNEFKHRIGASDTDFCPDCRGSTHSSNHLFECNAEPTDLSTSDLWEHPRKVVAHLRSCCNFQDLQDPGPSPPPPPPRP